MINMCVLRTYMLFKQIIYLGGIAKWQTSGFIPSKREI